MRIALICPYALSVPGGVQGQSRGLADALGARGHEVTVLAPGPPVAIGVGVMSESLGAVLAVPVNGSVAPVALSPAAYARTRSALRVGDYDVIHLEEPFVPMTCAAALVGGDAPLVGTFHRAGASAAYKALRPLLARGARRLSSRIAVSRAAASTLFEVSGVTADELLSNAVDPARFPERAHALARPAIVFVGRHEQRKGLAVLLEAFAGLAGDVELLVVGSGAESAALHRRYSEARITWLGRLDDQGVAAALSKATIFCAPSLGGESFGVVLLEAMAAGCAVVASDLPGYREAGGEVAHYVPPGDPAALRTALADLVGAPATVAALAVAGRSRAELHSFARLAARYEAIYHGLC